MTHEGQIYKKKIEILTVLGAAFQRFYPDKCEIWHGKAELRSAPPCQISRLSGQRTGRKSHFWTTTSKQYLHGCATGRPTGKNSPFIFISGEHAANTCICYTCLL